MQATEWDHRLAVRADGKNLIGHAGVVLLRKVADRVGLTTALSAALPKGAGPGRRDRGMALIQLACAIVLGATNILEAEQLQHHWRPVFGRPVSDSTLRRALAAIDTPVAARVERARAAIRRVVWTLLALSPGGFPWIEVCGRQLTGWYVLDLDATIVTCTSRKQGAAGTFKGSFGHMPLGAWVTGWAVSATDEQAIALLPENVWTATLRQDGQLHEIKGPDGERLSYQVAELTGLRDLTGRPKGMRLIVRRVKPSRRDAKKLTAFEKRTGRRYQIIATNIPAHQGLSGAPGTGQVWFVDALYRDHAEVEDRVKTIKRIGLGLLPSKSWQLNAAWVLAATIAADLDAWVRLLLLHDEPDLAAAEPDTIRTKLYHLPVRLTSHARRRTLHLDRTWPWAHAFTTAWQRATRLPARM